MLMDPVGLVRIHVKYKPSEIISCTLCYYLHVPSLSPRIQWVTKSEGHPPKTYISIIALQHLIR